MGLLNELNTINRTLQDNQKTIKKQMKEEEEIKAKIYIAKTELLDDLQTEIELTLKYNHNPKNAEIKGEIIDAILEYSHIIYNRQYTKAFLIENYDKISSKLIKQYERERKEEARQKEIQQKAQQKEYIERQKQKQIAFNNTMQALKLIMLLIASPFLLIIFFVWGIYKNIK